MVTLESILTTRLVTNKNNNIMLMQGYALHVVLVDNEFL